MTKYKVRARNAPDFSLMQECTIGVSVGSLYFEGDKLKAICEWVDKQDFQTCYFSVTDTAKRHNYIIRGFSEEDAYEYAKEEGDRWLERNKETFSAMKARPIFLRWDDWLRKEEVRYMIARFHQLYRDNKEYAMTVNANAQTFLSRQTRDGLVFKDYKTSHKKCVDFILEETGVHSAMAKGHPSFKIYPGRTIDALRVIHEGSVVGAPSGLENYKYVRLTVEQI